MAKYTGSKKHMLALNTFVKLVRATNSVCNEVHNHFLSELTVSQFGILEALYHLGPMAQKDLACKILKSPGNITTIINNLEKLELVRRQVNNDDKRYYTISLTTKGTLTVKRIFPVHADVILDRLSILTESEQRSLGKLLKKLSLSTI
ncbi:MAG: MarR family transcriptional regulator [Desulfobulbaceae bacterium]|nr:MarR family transcriptional regulator [Desulfobulbaceae bacterium]